MIEKDKKIREAIQYLTNRNYGKKDKTEEKGANDTINKFFIYLFYY